MPCKWHDNFTRHWWILPLWTLCQNPIHCIHFTCQEKPIRFTQWCHLNSICNNQTCHVICIWNRNRSTLLWLKNLHPPKNHPWIIWTLPIGASTSHHQQLHWPWPHPRHNGIKSIKLLLHAFPMVKMPLNAMTIQFHIGTWIHQMCRLPKQTSFPPTSHTRYITIYTTKQNK